MILRLHYTTTVERIQARYYVQYILLNAKLCTTHNNWLIYKKEPYL
jgi:hypothetical protein